MQLPRILATLAVFVSSITSCSSQSIDFRSLDTLFNQLEKHGLASGTISIIQDGKTIYSRSVNTDTLALIGLNPVNDSTRYRVGSVAKLLTAIAIFQLVEEGKLTLDKKLESYFKKIPGADQITIGHLLSHRSGLHDYTVDTRFSEWMDSSRTQEQMIDLIKNSTPEFNPGSRVQYNNSNYLLLSYILERECNASYFDVIKKRVLDKAGLRNTSYAHAIKPKNNEALSYSYSPTLWKEEKQTHPSIHSGSGAITSTPTDLGTLLHALFSGKLVSKKSLETMREMQDGIGSGLELWRHEIARGIGKGGAIEGFLARAFYFPGSKISIVYCTNAYLYPVRDIVNAAVDVTHGAPYTSPRFDGEKTDNKDFDVWDGVYKSKQMPLEVRCFIKGEQLIAETQGKEFSFIPIGNNSYMNKEFGFFFEFKNSGRELLIKEKDNVTLLEK
jgi:D-alanyl-D-alanine carboxypeptidase